MKPMSTTAGVLLVDATAAYTFCQRWRNLNGGRSGKATVRADYAALLERISAVVMPIARAGIAMTRDFNRAEQSRFVDSLHDAGYEDVEQVQFDVRPNTKAPLSVSIGQMLGESFGNDVVVVTNDPYIMPALLRHAKSRSVFVAFPKSGLHPGWETTGILGIPSEEGVQFPKGVTFVDLDPYRQELFGIPNMVPATPEQAAAPENTDSTDDATIQAA